MAKNEYDFAGWATKHGIQCADGLTIDRGAFSEDNGKKVPLVWNHDHSGPDNILGHALLEDRADGVYAYCKFNDSENADIAKTLVKHGDISSLSIYANKLRKGGPTRNHVQHGVIREVSLVLAGANPGAWIDEVVMHSDNDESEAKIFIEDQEFVHSGVLEDKVDDSIQHADSEPKKEEGDTNKMADQNQNSNKKTVKDIVDSMTEDQKNVTFALVGQALGENNKDNSEGDENMKHNVFDNDNNQQDDALMHAAMGEIIGDAKRCGSMKESFLQHAGDYGIDNIEYLFPDAKTLQNAPEFIKREMDWVSKVMNATHHTPFSRIKSVFADITEDEARAKGYIKGKLKKEEVFSLLKRTTTPTTIYKKQKLDRDDIIDITDFDVVAWLKTEMRMMLNEEIARAILIGDGRLSSSDDHINETNIRPVAMDESLYTIQLEVDNDVEDSTTAKEFIDSIIRSRKSYKGSGNPTLFTTEDVLTEMLLIEDGIGHKLYKTEAELATALRVKEIVTVPVMEDQVGKLGGKLLGIIVNLTDYNVGADKGGAINMFDDFDIDYNQQKYLIETRCSGALIKPFSAIAVSVKHV